MHCSDVAQVYCKVLKIEAQGEVFYYSPGRVVKVVAPTSTQVATIVISIELVVTEKGPAHHNRIATLLSVLFGVIRNLMRDGVV